MSRKFKLGKREYVLATMYTAPFIDILNGALNGSFSLGVILRGIIVLFNLFLISRNIPYKNKKLVYGVYFAAFFFALQILVSLTFFTGSLQHNLNFCMKTMLYLSEFVLLYNYLGNRRIVYIDFEKFWKYSSVVVPMSILIVNFWGIGTKGRAGFYTSTNALSIILVIQIVLSMYYAQKEKKNWLLVLINIAAVALMGTKSPLFFIAFTIITVIIFTSKNRMRTLVMVAIIGVLSYFIVREYFMEQWNSIIQYQVIHFSRAINDKSIFNYLVSGRNFLVSKTIEGISKLNLMIPAVLVGLSPYFVSSITGKYTGYSEFRGIEQDAIELLFCYGIFITIFVFWLFLRSLLTKCNNRTLGLYLNIAIICTLGYSILGGHAVTEAISATYCAILLATKQSISSKNIS